MDTNIINKNIFWCGVRKVLKLVIIFTILWGVTGYPSQAATGESSRVQIFEEKKLVAPETPISRNGGEIALAQRYPADIDFDLPVGEQGDLIEGWHDGVTVDVNPGDYLGLTMREADEDSTFGDITVPNPRIYVNVTEDGLRFEYVSPGNPVTFQIYVEKGGDLLWEGTQMADESGFAAFSIWDHRLDLMEGLYVVVSDGDATKDLLVEPLSLDTFDPEEDILAGTASPGRVVWVVANNDEIFCGREVVTGEGGNWEVDFSEQDTTCDVSEDMWAYVQAMDEDEDTTEAVLDFLEGYHDYDTGEVPSWACNAGGWVVDSDDRERDLEVQILAGEQVVATTSAGIPREDLVGVCGDDGSCGFEVSLWDSISHYEAQQITVQALDVESGQWFDLNDTPKTINCRTYDIYAYDPLTSETRQITGLNDEDGLRSADEYVPSWSPNGKKVAYHVVGDHPGIYITDITTGVSAPLPGGEGGGNAVWSQNGKLIAFDREGLLYIGPSSGGDFRVVREDAISADWAPNGKRLVFRQLSDDSVRTVAVAGEKGGETIVAERGWNPVWSPDGDWIAYDLDGDIWKVPVNIHGKVLGEPIQVTNNAYGDGQPTWSPDSSTIIYHAGIDGDYDLWSAAAMGGEPAWLTGAIGFGDYDPANAKNSAAVAYAGVSPEGQAAREWVSAFTYDLLPGTFGEGSTPYHFEFEWTSPEYGSWVGQGGEVSVSRGAPLQDGYVLLRGPFALRGFDSPDGWQCEEVGEVNPNQLTRFLVGWLPEFGAIPYDDARAHFESITARAVWDGDSAVLVRHEIIPFRWDDWFSYVCTFTAGPPKMGLRVNYGDDWVESFYEAGHQVLVTVTQGDGETLKGFQEVHTDYREEWGGEPGFQTVWEAWLDGGGNPLDSPPDIQPGDWVYAQVDNGASSQVQIGEISGMIDLETDAVTGTVVAGWFSDQEVGIECHPWGSPDPVDMKFDSISPNGEDEYYCTWLTDTGSEWDIQPGQNVGVGYSGPDGHWVANVISNPWLMAFPDVDQVFGNGWPEGTEVSLFINDEPIQTVPVGPAPWDENDILAFFDFFEDPDLVAGDVVKLTGSGIGRVHTVQNLAITEVDMEASTVSGTADPGAVVHAWVHGYGQDLELNAEGGTWMASFGSEDFHLEPGMCGRAEIRGGGFNATAVDWCLPLPAFAAYMPATIEGYDWPLGHPIVLDINAGEYTAAGTAEQRPDFPAGSTRVLFALVDFTLEAGDHILMSDEAIGFSKELWVADLGVTGFNLEAHSITGIYEPAYPNPWIQLEGQDPLGVEYAGNTWVATFEVMVPGDWGYIAQDDWDHDGTVWDFQVPVWPWQQMNTSGFGDPTTIGVTSLEVFHDQLYAGASNWDLGGQVWRLGGDDLWEPVSDVGFGAGAENPAVIDLAVFNDHLYAGLGWEFDDPHGQIWRSADGVSWETVTVDGFGDGGNLAVTSFVIFNDFLYAGTGNNTSFQIWRSDSGEQGSWEQAILDGPGFPGGVTGFAVYAGELYAAIEPPEYEPVQVWRSGDGSSWTVAIPDGFGDPDNVSTGGFTEFNGSLYLGTRNEVTGAQLWSTPDGTNWAPVVNNGFGDLGNIKIESLMAYESYLYAATLNPEMGIELWRSADGVSWEQVISHGFGNPHNYATLWNNATGEYQGHMVIGTWNYNEGGELWKYAP